MVDSVAFLETRTGRLALILLQSERWTINWQKFFPCQSPRARKRIRQILHISHLLPWQVMVTDMNDLGERERQKTADSATRCMKSWSNSKPLNCENVYYLVLTFRILCTWHFDTYETSGSFTCYVENCRLDRKLQLPLALNVNVRIRKRIVKVFLIEETTSTVPLS